MKKLFLSVLFFTQLSSAALNGEWVGWGQWSYDNAAVSCNPMKMTWTENEKTLAINKGIFECEVLVMHLGKTEWTKKEGLLFDEDNKQVGKRFGSIKTKNCMSLQVVFLTVQINLFSRLFHDWKV